MVYRRTPEVCRREARTRQSLLTAARAVVAESGLAGTSVAAVADRAGVGIGTVYRNFPSKSDLICEVVRDICSHELEVLRSVPVPANGDDRDHGAHAVEHLATVITLFSRRALRSGRTAYAVIVEPAAAEVELTRLTIRAELAEIFATAIDAGIELGVFPEQRASVSGVALVGAISEVLVGPLSPVTAELTDDEAESLLDDVVALAIRAVTGRANDRRSSPHSALVTSS